MYWIIINSENFNSRKFNFSYFLSIIIIINFPFKYLKQIAKDLSEVYAVYCFFEKEICLLKANIHFHKTEMAFIHIKTNNNNKIHETHSSMKLKLFFSLCKTYLLTIAVTNFKKYTN